MHDDRSFITGLVGDGRPLLALTAVCLLLSGLFAFFLSVIGQFLPHDVQYLGMTPEALCEINECRIVHFMLHDRVSFGGALIAVALMYLWLVEFPLRDREAWSWWLLLFSGLLGFGSFLAYLGYGYLDTWHGVATLALLPCFIWGMVRAGVSLPHWSGPACLLGATAWAPWRSRLGLGRACLLATAVGLFAGGLTIMTIGMTCVFVPEDLAYMGLSADDLHKINSRLVPLIAHDRAGFGGGVATYGVLMFFCLWCGRPSASLWQALALAGTAGFATAIGVHPVIGYTDWFHLAPAVAGAIVSGLGLALTFRPMRAGSSAQRKARSSRQRIAGSDFVAEPQQGAVPGNFDP
jgi:MFS family permease